MDPSVAGAISVVSGGVLAVLLAVAAYIQAKAKAVAEAVEHHHHQDDGEGGDT